MERKTSKIRLSDIPIRRKYSEMLPRSLSSTSGRGRRESFLLRRSRCAPSPTADSFDNNEKDDTTRQISNLFQMNTSDDSTQASSRPSCRTETKSNQPTRAWRKLRNALFVTSSAMTAVKRDSPSSGNSEAFLDYFSTMKHPGTVSLSHHHQQYQSQIDQQPSPKVFRNDELLGYNSSSPFPKRNSSLEFIDNDSRQPHINTPVPSTLNRQCTVIITAEPEIDFTPPESPDVLPIPPTADWESLEDRNSPASDLPVPPRNYLSIYYILRLICCLPRRIYQPKQPDSCLANASSEKTSPFGKICRTDLICNPQGSFIFFWLGIVTMATVYNLWTAIMRQAFSEIQKGKTALWITLDGIADLIYLVDILVQFRTCYLEKGLVVKDSTKIANRYVWSRKFAFDVLALLPLDLFQSVTGIQPLLRFPRFLKCFRSWHWKVMVENRTTFPNSWRVITLTHILFLGCHWFASFYYILSEKGDFDDPWGYPKPSSPELQSLLRKYLQSFYWATLTLTTIGDISEPAATYQYAFTTATYLIGVFVFATIVGQVGNIINNRNAARLSFENILDNAKSYMSSHHVPKGLRNRVLRWYDYAWQRRQLFGENDISTLGLLPDKLKTELALHVHLETLKKVTIFHECRPEFLHDLVLKMRPYIFTPGDLVCRNGEVAREMFIIADGVLEVIGKSGMIIKRLEAGDFFGEIGILCVNGGGNKRTADVRAVGYAELFVLSREDVLSALADHPDAHAIIMEHATKRLIESRSREEDAQIAFSQKPAPPPAAESVTTVGGLRSRSQVESPLRTREGSVFFASSASQRAPPVAIGPDPFATPVQTLTFKKDVFAQRQKEMNKSISAMTQFVEEIMFLVNTYSERIASRDERINELMNENTTLRRKLKEMREAHPIFGL